MGSLLSAVVHVGGAASKEKDEKDKDIDLDDRRRNSLAFYIAQYVNYEEDDFTPLVEMVKKDKYSKSGGKPPVVKNSKFGRIAESVSQGDAKELRNQVFVYFKAINRHYKDPFHENTILHMICQEGYYNMLTYMMNPANRSGLDDATFLEVSAKNDRDRVPLFLCFTPPISSYMGLRYGLDNEGNIKAEKPEDIEQATDWCRPGGPKSRENCIKLLLENGANVNEKDFQGFTALHYATMWGWISTVKLLLERGADINAMTDSGRTPLIYAVDFNHESLVTWYCSQSTKFGLQLDAADAEGSTALIIAVDKGEEGMPMIRTLLQHGADPNILTIRRRSALKIACQQQNVVLVNLLLDHKVQRRISAFNLLKDEAAVKIMNRLAEEEKRMQEEGLKAKDDQEEHVVNKNSKLAEFKKTGAWVEYRDKRSKKPFYYNTLTRKSTYDKPKDFKPDKNRIIKDVIFGMSFYH